VICPKCTAETLDGFSFCPQCGYAMPEKQEESSAEPVSVTSTATLSFAQESAEEDPDIDDLEVKTVSMDDETSEISGAFVQEPFVTESVEPVTPLSSTMDPKLMAAPAMVPASPPVVSVAQPVSPAAPAPAVSAESSVPKTHKPFTTGGVFWYLFVTAIPVVGFLVLVIVAAASKNLNRKSLSRAILLWHLVAVLFLCSLFTAMFFLNQRFLIEIFDFDNWFMTLDFVLRTFMY